MRNKYSILFSITTFTVLAIVLCQFMSGCAAKKSTTSSASVSHTMILRDEGLSQLSLMNMANPQKNWVVKVPAGRDLQLVGNGRVMIGTGNGYEERSIATGQKISELAAFPGTISVRRLRNGNTILSGLNWQNKKGIVLLEVDAIGTVKNIINYPAFNYVRLIRPTSNGTFLCTADDKVFEGDSKGNIIWQGQIQSKVKPHAWQAVRQANGNTLVSTGYGANFQIFDKSGKLVDSITGPASVRPDFFAGFQIQKNGNIVVSNWQGHGAGHGSSGVQVLAFSPEGKLAWQWQQDAATYSSIQGLIVLDGLNTDKLHVEDSAGKLIAVN